MIRERFYAAFAVAVIILSAPAFTLAAPFSYWESKVKLKPEKATVRLESLGRVLDLKALEETRAFGKVQAGFSSSGTNLQMTDAAFSPEAAEIAGPPPAEIVPLGSALPPEAASGFGPPAPTLNPTGTPGVFSLGGITIDTLQTVPLSGQGQGLMNEHHLGNFAASPPGGDFINNLMSLRRPGSNGDDLVLAALARAEMNLLCLRINQNQIDETIATLAAQLKELKKDLAAVELIQGGGKGGGGVGLYD